MIDYKKELNPEQYKVASQLYGPILVLAGAGSGKTRTLTYRVSYMIEHGIDSQNILVLTFTTKAAREMLQRLEGLLGANVKVEGGTFHHFGNVVLREFASSVGRKKNFTILDSGDRKILLRALLRERGISKDSFFPKIEIIDKIFSLSVNTQKSVGDTINEQFPQFFDVAGDVSAIFDAFEDRKRETNAMDFDDLLLEWYLLLQKNPQAKSQLQDKFKFLLVDEFQDTNQLQGLILQNMAGIDPNLMVVGDDSQSIYSFRGAQIKNILDFPQQYPKCKIFRLEKNYRSTQEILALANSSIINNRNQFEKKLISTKAGDKPRLVVTSGEAEQSEWIANKIEEMENEGTPLSEIAVLFRAGSESLELELELTRRGVPFIKRGGVKFFDSSHIKDIISFLRIEDNIVDEAAWRRILVLFDGIGIKTQSKIIDAIKASYAKEAIGLFDNKFSLDGKFAQSLKLTKKAYNGFLEVIKIVNVCAKEKTVDTKIKAILDGFYSEYLKQNFEDAKDRLDDILALMSFAKGKEDLSIFLDEVKSDDKFQEEDNFGSMFDDFKDGGTVALSTIHQAKGLEWKVVFLMDVIEDYMPSYRAINEKGGVEEERRLFYVAVTRAKDILFLMLPLTRGGFGGGRRVTAASRFLKEVDRDLYERTEW